MSETAIHGSPVQIAKPAVLVAPTTSAASTAPTAPKTAPKKIIIEQLPDLWEYAIASGLVILLTIMVVYLLYQWYGYRTTISTISTAVGVEYSDPTQFGIALAEMEHDVQSVNQLIQQSDTDTQTIASLQKRVDALNAQVGTLKTPPACPPTLDPSLVFDTSNSYILDHYMGSGNGAAMQPTRSSILTAVVDPVLGGDTCGAAFDDISNRLDIYNASLSGQPDPCLNLSSMGKLVNSDINQIFQQWMYCPGQPYTAWVYVQAIDPATNQPTNDPTMKGWVPSMYASLQQQPILNAVAANKKATQVLAPQPAMLFYNGPTGPSTLGFAVVDPAVLQISPDPTCTAAWGTMPDIPVTIDASAYSSKLVNHVCGLDKGNKAAYDPVAAKQTVQQAKNTICDDSPTSAVRLGLERGVDMVLGRIAKNLTGTS